MTLCASLLLAACSCATTVVNHIWSELAPGERALGKTLVFAVPFNPVSETGARAESAWVRHLRRRGIDAYAWNLAWPGAAVPEVQAVAAAAREGGFDTLLVARVVELKQVERETPASQVAVVETGLYDVRSGRVLWLVQTDTYLISFDGEVIRYPRESVIREYVEVVSRAMFASGVE